MSLTRKIVSICYRASKQALNLNKIQSQNANAFLHPLVSKEKLWFLSVCRNIYRSLRVPIKGAETLQHWAVLN